MKNNLYMPNKRRWVTLALLAALPAVANAQDAEVSFLERATAQEMLLLFALGLMVFITLAVLVVAVYTLNIMKMVIAKEQKAKGIAPEKAEELSWWTRFDRSVTDAIPLEKEHTILLDHNYDGIRELDNHLPPWWKWLFYISIGWSAVYLFVYHVAGTMPLQEQEYNTAVAEAKQAVQAKLASGTVELIDESSVAFSDEASVLANGKTLYKRNCAVCHQEDGGGLVGPNLTDDYWLHGGSMSDIFKVIKYGVPQKGMIAWESQLTPSDIRDVSSYIITMRGTTPAVAKEPQGTLYKPSQEVQEAEKTDEAGESQE